MAAKQLVLTVKNGISGVKIRSQKVMVLLSVECIIALAKCYVEITGSCMLLKKAQTRTPHLIYHPK